MGGGPGTNYRVVWRFRAGRMPGCYLCASWTQHAVMLGLLGWGMAYVECFEPY